MWGKRRKLYHFKWDGESVPSPEKAFASFAYHPYSLFFDSAQKNNPLSTQSYICVHPFETLESKDGVITHTSGAHTQEFSGNPFEFLQERIDDLTTHITNLDETDFFTGGAAGYFGYDLARHIESLPDIANSNDTLPDMIIGFYDQVIRFDLETNDVVFYITAKTPWEAKRRFKTLQASIQSAQDIEPYPAKLPSIHWTPTHGDAEYRQDIRKVIEYIYAGDIFQACLSRRFTSPLPENFDHYRHYLHLRDINAAPFASYMNFGDVKFASTSPERFLKLQNRQIETRPIKGTLSSALSAQQLTESLKDCAENAMIVDLLRNDLSKVCTDFSIKVPALCEIETYEGLHHLVSVIKGELRADKSACDLLQACFPGGSISGAPKIRAMEIIEEIEPYRRGPWCGSMGMIGFNGMMDINIMIRTIIYDGNTAHIQTGGGITAQSDPNDELAETLLKAEKLFESFQTTEATANNTVIQRKTGSE